MTGAATKTLGLVAVALVAGALIGSIGPLRERLTQSVATDPQPAEAREAPGRSTVGARPSAGEATETPDAGRERFQVRYSPWPDETSSRHVAVTDELHLKAVARDGRFFGFEVTRAEDDPRFSVGDVIVAVNGEPVEGSPAGSERMIIDLNRENAEFDIVRE